MTFVADESVDREVVDHLRNQGFTVTYIAEKEPSLADDLVLSIARSESAILLTADKDFGELIYRRGQLSAGVILIRLPRLTPQERAFLIEQIIKDHLDTLSKYFCVITDKRVRLRKL